ncbi:winged helix-turn-helix transcriptional regulator [Enteractinococcus helveticum]|uniref:HxlR family transcriptional regulator n=1 Tax=Enteractinococcus helveticum TaxID=1837282 RepID=A0A1B7M275_9MICC|nr:helix-turn-helix domain-containing protein [Enteractinococcus helveticum]OAV62674.1 HxlR family transcriptional regulator [Enteractinococcus helveticum]
MTQSPQLSFDTSVDGCPSRSVLRHATDRWTPHIVPVLANGPLRFTQLKKSVAGISSKVLTETLRSLQRDGLVSRHVDAAQMPVRVDYELTDLGRTLILPLGALRTWAETYAGDVLASRERFDTAHDSV